MSRPRRYLNRAARWAAALVATGLCGLLVNHIVGQLRHSGLANVSSIYTIIIACYVYSRFVLAAMYRPPRNAGIEPTVAIVVPAFNENEAVERTIDSCAKTAYPLDKLEIVVVNDGRPTTRGSTSPAPRLVTPGW